MAAIDKEALHNAYEAVRDDKSEEEWALFGYNDSKTIVHLKSGTSYEEFLSELNDDNRCFGYLRINSGDELSKRAKFALVTWIGTNVAAIKRGMTNTDKSSVKAVVKNFAIEISADNKNDLELESVRDSVRKAGGANYGTGQR